MSDTAEDTGHRWTAEEARERAVEGGKASAEARRQRAAMSPEQRAREAVRSKSPDLIEALLNVALGRGDFEVLATKERVPAIIRALEYGIGKPSARPAEEPEPDPDAESPGIRFGNAADS